MKEFEDLTFDEKVEVLKKAKAFKKENKRYVEDRLKRAKHGIAPSGSDLNHPELWKGIHWYWFVNRLLGNKEEA